MTREVLGEELSVEDLAGWIGYFSHNAEEQKKELDLADARAKAG